MTVVPHAGTWIEIDIFITLLLKILSFPTRERGLKLYHLDFFFHHLLSFPTRERGLKYCPTGTLIYVDDVVPHAGTWIEIWNMS